VLLHGWQATAALDWYGSFEALGQDFAVTAPNLRGHGVGGRRTPPFSVEGCADDVAALITTFGAVPVIAVGYSMGGAVAQVLGRKHPELLRGMVLCATAASFAKKFSARPLVRALGGGAARAMRSRPAPSDALLRWQLRRHSGRGDAPGWALAERAQSELAAFIEAAVALNSYDSTPWLAELDVPTAVVVTTHDRVLAPERQLAMARLLPGARLYWVGAGHDAAARGTDLFVPVLAQACMDMAGSSLTARGRPAEEQAWRAGG
jgi:pimeloyl-ACP methyl ester carboxylesterase